MRALPLRVLAGLLLAGWACPGTAADPPPAGGPGTERQEAGPDLRDLSLEELLDIEVFVPTRSPRKLRGTPGIVTVVTREEIVESGARDLIDVLRRVPGFELGVDVQGAVSVGFRGNWAAEGKVLVLVDGFETNEPLYLTVQLGTHYPVDIIERIEIMRGPGSVVYGGMAELAVLNIITRQAEHLDGASVSGTYGQMEGGLGRRTLSVYGGHVFESLGGLTASVATVVGEGRRSDAEYADFSGNRYSLTDLPIDPFFASVSLGWKGLTTRFMVDDTHTRPRDAFDESEAQPVRTDFRGLYLGATYDFDLTPALQLSPSVTWKRQQPWRVSDPAAAPITYYEKTADRLTSGLVLRWDPISALGFLLGAEYAFGLARLDNLDNVGVGLQQPFGASNESEIHTGVAYAQATASLGATSVVAGARYEGTDRFGHNFVPRFAVTHVADRLHLKLLFSKAFKAPGHENLGLSPDVRAERVTAMEVEAGYQIGDSLSLSVNVFDVTINDPIVFEFVDGAETYANFPRTGTRGVEAEARLQLPSLRAYLAYSFYSAADKNEVPAYAVPQDPSLLRGFPAHKLTLDVTIPLYRRLALRAGGTWIGERYGAVSADEAGQPVTGREAPVLLLDAYLSWRDLLVPGLDLGLGVFDLLDSGYRFLQPHDSGHAPLPGPTREYVVRIGYTVPLK